MEFKPMSSSFQEHAPRETLRSRLLSVQSRAEYILATQVHVQRVGLLAQELLRRHPDQFPGLDPLTLAEFASIHDSAKITTDPAFLAEHNLERPLADDLAHHWGALLKPTPDASNPLVEQVNRVDRAVEAAFFGQRGISSQTEALYRLIVEVADKVDRGMSPLSRYEEMGKRAVRVAEYLKLSSHGHDEVVARLATELEADYAKLIPKTMNYFDARKAP